MYQALSYRPASATLEAEDDNDWTELFTGWDAVTLTHTPEHGRRTYHPDPERTRAEAQRHHNTDNRTQPEPATTHTGQDKDTRQDKDDGQDKGTEQDRDDGQDGPTTPWTHDPTEPPPF